MEDGPWLFRRPGRAGQDLSQVGFQPGILAPLLGIAQRNLFEAGTVTPIGATDMQMAADAGQGAVAAVPVRGGTGTTPGGEAGHARQEDELFAQRK